LEIPTIGIGAVGCDGQSWSPRFVGFVRPIYAKIARRYADIHGEMKRAFAAYKSDVEAKAFPEEQTIEMSDDEWGCSFESLEKMDQV
jgi:ketopantoate hydroxymethyltransferase